QPPSRQGVPPQNDALRSRDKDAELEPAEPRGGKRPRSNLLTSITSALPFSSKRSKGEAFDLELQKQEFGSSRWSKVALSSRIRSGDILSLILTIAQEDLALCVIYSRTDRTSKQVLFPEWHGNQLSCGLIQAGTQLVIPERVQPSVDQAR